MTAWEAYEHYAIMPNLRLHQLRVAAIAQVLAIGVGADVDRCTKAGLLHDMGNIMKSDLTQFPPEFYGDRGIAYWESVKHAMRRFGEDEHQVTAAIARDMGVDEGVISIIDSMGFSRATEIDTSGSIETKVLEYADQRVAPFGITTMSERLREGRARYAKRRKSDFGESDADFERNQQALSRIEESLFRGLTMKPEDLTEDSLQETMNSLREYRVA